MRKIIGLTLGDPAGIGPEVALKALSNPKLKEILQEFEILLIGSGFLIEKFSQTFSLPQDLQRCDLADELVKEIEPGKPTPDSARASLMYIDKAIELALEGKINALVTGPVSKKMISNLGIPFSGHTEYIAGKTLSRTPVMMFVCEKFKVALVSTHLPIKKVPSYLNPDRIIIVVRVLDEGLRNYFGIPSPRIGICGLNPHAGEDGFLGMEEAHIISPAIEKLRMEGINAEGPYPADSIFRESLRKNFDVILAMYHDQALIPIKAQSRSCANLTLGLPFIRTSVDHGTGFDIAGKLMADPSSMISAIKLASKLLKSQAQLF